METSASVPESQVVPVLPGLPILGNVIPFLRDPLGLLLALQRKHPRMVRLSLAGRHQYLVMQPEDAKYVLQENNRNYGRSPAFEVLKLFVGESLLTTDGDSWLRQRRLMQPAFHRQKLAGLTETMTAEAESWVEALKQQAKDQPVNLTQSLQTVTMRIVCKTLFGTDVKGDQLAGLSQALETVNLLVNKRAILPFSWPMWVPTPSNTAFLRATERVDKLLYGFIKKRRQTPDAVHNDLLDMLIQAQDETTGERMSDQQVRNESVTLFTAGHETSALGVGWALWLLAQHPDVVSRMRQEVSQVLGEQRSLPIEALRQLTYTTQVIQEVLRLYPPAWALTRQALSDDVISGYPVPAGATVVVSPYLLHRDPEQWEQPERFDPDRFSPEKIAQRHPYAHLPFGGGPRICIGNQFALMEMQILLIWFVRAFDIRLPAGPEVRPKPLITFRPAQDIRLIISAVAAAQPEFES